MTATLAAANYTDLDTAPRNLSDIAAGEVKVEHS
jgi:hypothetical protein